MFTRDSYYPSRDPRRLRRVILHAAGSLDGGGTERTLVALLRSFDRTHFRHVVVALRTAGKSVTELPGDVACRSLCSSGRAWAAGLQLAEIAREVHAEIVHARNTGAWFDATVASLLTPGARLVLGFHGLETAQTFDSRRRLRARFGLWAGATFTCVSEAGKRQLHDQAGVPLERTTVLHNGVDLRRFRSPDTSQRRAARAAWRLDPDDVVVGTVGSLTPVKQQAMLIRAVARVAQSVGRVRLLIVGGGPLRSALADEAQASGIGDRVIFTGPQEDVSSLLHGMDVYVCSSLSEGMSNAMLEAMAVGLPIVTTDVGDHAAIVREAVDGRVVAPGSVSEMAGALEGLIEEPEVRRGCGVSARTRATEFGVDRMVSAYDGFYERLTARSGLVDRGVAAAAPLPGAV